MASRWQATIQNGAGTEFREFVIIYLAVCVEAEFMGYSSYTFGAAPTTIPRSSLGDPAKFRLVHGGSEVFHSHHPHGGTIRWLRSPRSSDEMPLWFAAKNGPVK